jgi:putative endonuclease
LERGRHRTRALGAKAEHRAERFLSRHGLTTLTRNFHCRFGEIDLVMAVDNCVVFVEVRYRSDDRFALPALTVDRRKQRKLVRAAAMYIAAQPRLSSHILRFDVVAIAGNSIEWIADAFRPADSSL